MIRLMLVDDHAMLREGLRSKFERCADIQIVAEAGAAEELMSLLGKASPDVLIVDIKLPDANGISLMEQIKKDLPKVKVIILTMYDHVRYALHSFERGADGFVVKGAPFEELLQAVRDVIGGKTYVSSEMAAKLVGRLKKGKPAAALDLLSKREFEVLTMLSGGLSIKQTAEQLGLSSKSVTTYRTRVMEKLHLNTNADIVRYAMETGLLE